MFGSKKIDLYFDKSNSRNYEILRQCPHLYQGAGEFKDRNVECKGSEPSASDNTASYKPPFPLVSTHLMNYYAAYLKKKLDLKYKREVIVAPDGGTVSLDWFDFGVEFKPETPTIFMLHGLTGGSYELYIQYFAKYAFETAGFRSVVLNYRGCAGNEVTADMAYCGIQIEDMKYVITNHFLPKCEGAPLFAVGFSLGSVILVNFLADQGEKSPFIAAVSVSNPVDMMECSRNLASTFINNKFYNEALSNNLKTLFSRFGNRLDKYCTPKELAACKTIYDFDVLITSKMFGFPSAEEYYRNASSLKHIDTLKKPILFINALDDPISPGYALPLDKFRHNPNTMLATTPEGGHLGFISSVDWESWSDKAAIEYFLTFLSG